MENVSKISINKIYLYDDDIIYNSISHEAQPGLLGWRMRPKSEVGRRELAVRHAHRTAIHVLPRVFPRRMIASPLHLQ